MVYVSFDGNINSLELLKKRIRSRLLYTAEEYEITLTEDEEGLLLEELVIRLYKKYKTKVVMLIDEYDKPILDVIDNKEVAIANREKLKHFYGVLKPLDAYVKFVFITVVSKFSKVSLFSGLNQLRDITISEEYSTICGCTQKEFEQVFSDRVLEIDVEEMRHWYNGYSWLVEPVYNPFDVLLYLAEKSFRAYWFETGTPSFLIKVMLERKYYLPKLSKLNVGEELIGSFDVDAITPENLLFQTGYLTIAGKSTEIGDIRYTLRFPNKEVQVSFNNYFLNYLVEDYHKKSENKSLLRDAFRENNFEKIRKIFESFFRVYPMSGT